MRHDFSQNVSLELGTFFCGHLEMLRFRHGYCALHQEETGGCFAFLHQSEDEGVLSVNCVTCVTDLGR